MKKRPCGDRNYLEAMLTSPASPEELDELAEHLELCQPCRDLSDHIAAGRQSWRWLRRLSNRPPSDESPTSEILSPDDDALELGFLRPSSDPDRLGHLGPYEVIEVIGRGGMGIVFKVQDTTLDRVVAIKVLSPQNARSGLPKLRFAREARAAASVVHDHVVAIHSVCESAEVPYLVMEYVPGESLQDRIDREGPLPIAEILRIGRQAASGLAAAHSRGVVHRDIKPANILLGEGGRVKITDFGLARVVDNASLTRSGIVAGTPLYMAPEQAMGGSVDARSDLFSLGSVLYSMCVGSSPFQGDSTMAVLRRVCDEEPRPVEEIRSDVPERLGGVIGKLLEKDPSDRHQTALEVVEALGALPGLLGPTAFSGSSFATAAPSPGRREKRTMVVVGAALATLASALVATAFLARSKSDRSAERPMPARPQLGRPGDRRAVAAEAPISGRVVDRTTGMSVPGASVEFHPRLEVEGHPRDQTRVTAAVSGPDGSFQLAGRPGPGLLIVKTTDRRHVAREFGGNLEVDGRLGGMRCYAQAFLSLDFVPDAGLRGVELSPRRGVTLRGCVEGPDGRIVARAKVLSRSNATGEHPSMQSFASTAVDGRFELTGCAPGEEYEVFVADAADGWGGTCTIGAPGDDAPATVIRLSRAGSAVARFEDTSGRPIVGCDTSVSIVLIRGIDLLESIQPDRRDELASQEVSLSNLGSPSQTTDESGMISLQGLIPGARYRVVLISNGRIAASVGFTAESGTTVNLKGVVEVRPAGPKPEPSTLPLLERK